MTVIEALRQLMTSEMGIGVAGTTFFLADQNIPTDMNTIYYSLFQTGGRSGILTHDAGTVPEVFFQLSTRHGKYIEAQRAAEAAWKKFVTVPAISNRTVDDKFFLWVRPLSPTFSLSADAQQRARVAFNIGTSVRDVVLTP
jgi:hypothetical protein